MPGGALLPGKPPKEGGRPYGGAPKTEDESLSSIRRIHAEEMHGHKHF